MAQEQVRKIVRESARKRAAAVAAKPVTPAGLVQEKEKKKKAAKKRKKAMGTGDLVGAIRDKNKRDDIKKLLGKLCRDESGQVTVLRKGKETQLSLPEDE